MTAFASGVKKLGFGLMRLPRTEDGAIDLGRTIEMVDKFLSAGFTYFDTAYRYAGSEEIARQAIVERYPRDSYTIASKLPLGFNPGDPDTLQGFTDETLRRLGTDYVDYYMLHGLHDDEKANELDAWSFMKGLKEKGVAKHIGMSYHGKADMLDKILTEHPEMEFVQLQINYYDWEDKDVQGRLNYEVCTKHGVPVIVMEPVKGGNLVNIPEECAEPLAKLGGGSVASYAVRYAASPENVKIVLSGMSNMDQMNDNAGFMEDFKPFESEEYAAVEEVVARMKKLPTIQCTGCAYCVENCPSQIPIPQLFKIKNDLLLFGNEDRARASYARATDGKGKAGDCVECGLCEGSCPQELPIRELLKQIAADYE